MFSTRLKKIWLYATVSFLIREENCDSGRRKYKTKLSSIKYCNKSHCEISFWKMAVIWFAARFYHAFFYHDINAMVILKNEAIDNWTSKDNGNKNKKNATKLPVLNNKLLENPSKAFVALSIQLRFQAIAKKKSVLFNNSQIIRFSTWIDLFSIFHTHFAHYVTRNREEIFSSVNIWAVNKISKFLFCWKTKSLSEIPGRCWIQSWKPESNTL